MRWLIHKDGDRIVRQISLKESKYTLGRGINNDIIFDTPKVSRLHAVLVKEGEAYHIIDQDSTNHVFVNSEQVTRKTLTSGDTIHLSDKVTLLYLNEHDFHEQITELLDHMWNAINKEDFLRLKEVTDRIISLDNLEYILQIVLKEVVNLVGAERGFITLTDEKGKIQKNTRIVHNIPLEQKGDWESIFSRSTVQQAIHTREPVFILRSGGDEPHDFSYSIIALNLQSVMCAPLLFGNKLVGVLYVDSGYQLSDFSEGDRFFFTILSDHAAIAIENAKLYSQVQCSIQQLSLNEFRLEALLQINQMTQAPIKEICAFGLEKALKLSRSHIGYIGFVDKNGTILSINCWSKNVINLCARVEPLVYPLKNVGMWGKAVKQRKPIINNEPVVLKPLQEGYPDDHITITRHLNIPVFEGERIVAVLGVGNKEHAYDTADVRQLTLLMQAMWRLIQRKRAEESLRESEEKHRIVLESVPDPVAVYDLEGRMTYLNPAFTRVFGWTLANTITQTSDFVPSETLAEAEFIVDEITHGKTVSGIETCRLTREGTLVDVSISGAGFFDTRGQLQGYVLTFQNVTERKKIEKEIAFLAYHDVLTRLPNRKSFYIRLEDELVQSHNRAGGDRRVKGPKKALLFLDVDKFKYVNETLGHDAGDELLKLVAARLQHCLRKSDYVFRLGDDEFTIILTDLTDDTDVAKVAKKLQEEIAGPCCIKGHELYVTVSIGISIYPNDGDDVETLVKNADMAMNAAKEKGQGYRFFTEEMNRNALERMMLESSLRNALQHNQFVIYYQPLVDDKQQIIGMEALLRWHHPELGLISPSQFIPLAEETGIIIPVGKWVLSSTCQQVRKWHEMGHTKAYVAVNLSPRQFREPDLVEMVEQVLEDTGLAPDYLKLEVTESGIMENPEQAITTMKMLRAKGVGFSIDDFGTGYSSLSYLKRFPIDTLKIDRSFVAESMTNKGDQEIIKMIISMARNLNIDTVAEGIEDKEQLDFLVRHGCRMLQGYYFGRPMPADQFEEMLQRTRS